MELRELQLRENELQVSNIVNSRVGCLMHSADSGAVATASSFDCASWGRGAGAS